MKINDWVSLVKWSENHNVNISEFKLDKNGSGEIADYNVFVVTDEMRKISEYMNRFQFHLIFISKTKVDKQKLLHGGGYPCFPAGVAELMAIAKCKDIFKRDYDIDLNLMKSWLLYSDWIFNFKDGSTIPKTVNQEKKLYMFGYM